MKQKLALPMLMFVIMFVIMFAVFACRLPWQEEFAPTEPTDTAIPETPAETTTEPPFETSTATVTPTDTEEPSTRLSVFSDPVIFTLGMFTPSEGWAVTQDGNNLLVTEDGGATWLNATPSAVSRLPPGIASFGIRPFFMDENIAWFTPGNTGMLYHTQDKGINWETTTLPFDNGTYFFLNLNDGFAMANLGAATGSHYVAIYQTSDGGNSWTEVFSHEPGESKSLPESGAKSGMTFLDINQGWIGGSIPMTDYFYLHSTSDGGATWEHVTDITLPDTFAGNFLDVSHPFFVSYEVGYLPVRVLSSNGDMHQLIYRSNDSGQSWIFQNAVSDGRVVDFSSVDEGWLAGGTSLNHTTDGGATWETLSTPGIPSGEYFISVDSVDSMHGWVLTTPDDSTWDPLNLFHTTDGGNSWTLLQP